MSTGSVASPRYLSGAKPLVSRRVIMVGTHPDTMGGISSVVRGYRQGGLFERFDMVYVVTHRDGSRWKKLVTAVRGWLALMGELARGGAPLVHIHLSARASTWRKWIASRIVRAARRPYLLHSHGSEFMQFYRSECSPWRRRLIETMFAQAAGVIALSERWREDLGEVSPTSRFVILPNAVALPERPSQGPAQGNTILFLGRLGERKGVFDLIRAFARVAARHPDARLVCAGDGENEAAAALATELGIADRASFPGWLDEVRKREAIDAASIFALPSLAEGLPMSMLEAMSWGLVPVVTPVGGIAQVVHHDFNGVVVRPRDVLGLARELDALLSQPQRRARLGAAARDTIAASFSLEQSLDRLARLYAEHGVTPRSAVCRTA